MAKTYEITQTLEDRNFFLNYPRDMMEDINDKHPGSIIDYEVNENDLTLTITEEGHKNLKAIKELIAKM